MTTTPAELAAAINKRFGEGSIGIASDEGLVVRRWPTGVAAFDDLLDGGIPQGRMIEAYGPYSTLKSFFLYTCLGAVQRSGGRAALIDTEHSFDPEWADFLGVSLPDLMISRPQNAEHGIAVLETLVRQRYDICGFDSIASAVPKQHQEVAPGEDNQPGALARVMSKGLARVNAANTTTSLIFINQTRNKIGVSFGSPVTTSGGLAMGFYASYRISFTRIAKDTETVKRWDGDKMAPQKQVIGHKIQATLEKSKLSAPHTDVIFTYDLRTGRIDDTGYVITKALQTGAVTRTDAGMWDIPGVISKPIRGAAKFREYLDKNPELVARLTALVI